MGHAVVSYALTGLARSSKDAPASGTDEITQRCAHPQSDLTKAPRGPSEIRQSISILLFFSGFQISLVDFGERMNGVVD